MTTPADVIAAARERWPAARLIRVKSNHRWSVIEKLCGGWTLSVLGDNGYIIEYAEADSPEALLEK